MQRSLLGLALVCALPASAFQTAPASPNSLTPLSPFSSAPLSTPSPTPQQRITRTTRLIAGHVLVKPDAVDGARDGAVDGAALATRLGQQLHTRVVFQRKLVLGWVLLDAVDVDDEAATLALVAAVERLPGVQAAAAEWVMRPFATPADPFFEFMWHLDAIGAREAWDITEGSTGNRVGVVDTGTAFSHEDLQGKRGAEFDFISDDFQSADGGGRDTDATDPGDAADCDGDGQLDSGSSFHGTHVAGTILASGDNGTGVTGINWNARVVTGRALGRCGGTTVDIDEAVAWMAGFRIDGVPDLAAAERPRVVNLSLGATGAPCDGFTNDVWNQVTARGVVIVVASGNDSSPGNIVAVASPANCPASLAVAAFGPRNGNQLAPYSNFGAEIDIVAPGGDQSSGNFEDGVLSSIDASISPFQDGQPYTFYEGTSMAAPHVAGVISLMLDANPGLTVVDVGSLLKSNSGSCTGCQGKPALRADLAVAAAAGTTISTDPGDSCAGTQFCSSGQVCANVAAADVCLVSCDADGDCGGDQRCAALAGGAGGCVDDSGAVPGGEGEGEPGEGFLGECDIRRGNLDCDIGRHCDEDDGVGSCKDGEGATALGALCADNDDCSTGLCNRGVCTRTCEDLCFAGYSCSDEDDSGVPGGLCVADSCLEDTGICANGFSCSYSSEQRYVCATGPSNYDNGCGAQPAAWAPIPAAAALLALLRRRRHTAR